MPHSGHAAELRVLARGSPEGYQRSRPRHASRLFARQRESRRRTLAVGTPWIRPLQPLVMRRRRFVAEFVGSFLSFADTPHLIYETLPKAGEFEQPDLLPAGRESPNGSSDVIGVIVVETSILVLEEPVV